MAARRHGGLVAKRLVNIARSDRAKAKSFRVDDPAAHRRRGMENGLAYHFVICNGTNGSSDGKVEVGARWLRQIKGGHVKSSRYNENSIGICVVGNFEKRRPTARQQASLIELIDYLKHKTLSGKPKFMVHRELEKTICPGKYFPVTRLHQLFG